VTSVIGLDPGVTGGVALLPEGCGAEVYPMPGGPLELYTLLRGFVAKHGVRGTGFVVWSEKAFLMPSNGAKANFAVGRSAGLIQMACAALGLPLYEVAPNTWRPAMVGRGKDKEASRLLAIQHYPHLADRLKFKNSHGLAEALLIAEWGKTHG